MVDSAAARARGRARASWAPNADEADSSAIGEDAGGDPATLWRVIRVRGVVESTI